MSETDKSRLRVLIADDHPMMREGLALVLQSSGEVEVVGQAGDGLEAVRLFAELQPDIALMDLQMPKLNGVEAIAAIRRQTPKARIIVMTTYFGDVLALRAMKAGASGFLLKTSVRRDLLEAMRVVNSGRRYLPPDVANEIAVHAVDEPLTMREIDILRLVASGSANRQIGHEMGVSEETVKAHMKSIFAKLGVADRTHAVTLAVKRGIIDL